MYCYCRKWFYISTTIYQYNTQMGNKELLLKGKTAIRIHPSDDLHRIIEKTQSFLHITGQGELSKEDVCLRLISERAEHYEKKMLKYAEGN